MPQSPSSSGDSRLSVTVLTDRTTPHTTADGAAGIWGPYLLTGTPLGDQERWARETHDMIERMWNTPGGGKDLGIALQVGGGPYFPSFCQSKTSSLVT